MADRLFLRLPDDPLYAPETTVPSGTMQAFAVPPELAPWVANALAYEEHLPPGAEVTEHVLPDGALRLIVDSAAECPTVRVLGPAATAVVLTQQGHLQGLSLTLRSGASLVLLGVPAHELAGAAHAWDAVVDARSRTLVHRLDDCGSDASARMAGLFSVLSQVLRSRSALHHTSHDTSLDASPRERVRAAMGFLQGCRAQRPVSEAASALGIGERRLEQLFREQLGLSPKTWHRLARFHECVRLLRRRHAPGWADLAAEAGFHDQAHLVHEFRAIAGLMPSQFAAATAVSDFSKTAV